METTRGDRPTVKFMIMMPWGRVGSNLLFSNIGQAVRQRRRRLANENFIKLKEGVRQSDWVRQFYGDAQDFDVVGSKQNILSVRRPDALSDVLVENEVRLIRMRRDNIVKVAISQLRAELYAERTRAETGMAVWGVRRAQAPLGPTVLGPRRFLRVVAKAKEADGLLSRFAPPVATFDIEYEEFQANLDHLSKQVCEWLGLEVDEKIQPIYIKATPDDLATAVPNLEELRAALRASALADLDPMFDR
jgi:hypothetical protein